MEGWVPFPAAGWEDTARLLTLTGQPWPEAACIMDLRWHFDQGKTRPGRPTLAKRWAWTDHAVRVLLQRIADWWDPSKGEVPDPPSPARLQPSPAGRQETDGKVALFHTPSPDDRQGSASASPHARLISPSPSPSPKKNKYVGKGDELPPLVAQAYVESMSAIGLPITPTKPERLGIRRCLNDGATPEDIAVVLRWMATSHHSTAIFLREKGFIRSETPWRPSKYEAYLGFARLRAPVASGHYNRPADDVLPTITDDGGVF